VYDDEPTMYGSILFAGNVQNVKSAMIAQLMQAGAIPIAKMQLGTFAWSSANGWGECMSPYLNGPGCGSSCGSGSGAALGALPFAVSEETSGSIACPASASLISGHIGSYGAFSRAGAGLLCAETDHLGFHSRYLSDYGVIFNYARTGHDPLDGDSVAHDFVNPASVDVTQLRVMIVEGEGAWEYDAETGSYSWNDVVRQSYDKTAWHWPHRVANIKAALDAAGVSYDSFTSDEAGNLWSFNENTTYFDCADPSIDVMMAGGPVRFSFLLCVSRAHIHLSLLLCCLVTSSTVGPAAGMRVLLPKFQVENVLPAQRAKVHLPVHVAVHEGNG
jgi:Asp-tRNA(Asn)/Glu-tRNA(Gln) amidotransferase A subunit family amidase